MQGWTRRRTTLLSWQPLAQQPTSHHACRAGQPHRAVHALPRSARRRAYGEMTNLAQHRGPHEPSSAKLAQLCPQNRKGNCVICVNAGTLSRWCFQSMERGVVSLCFGCCNSNVSVPMSIPQASVRPLSDSEDHSTQWHGERKEEGRQTCILVLDDTFATILFSGLSRPADNIPASVPLRGHRLA